MEPAEYVLMRLKERVAKIGKSSFGHPIQGISKDVYSIHG